LDKFPHSVFDSHRPKIPNVQKRLEIKAFSHIALRPVTSILLSRHGTSRQDRLTPLSVQKNLSLRRMKLTPIS
jgi:hypothetical protein